jgi:Leucine-rich repeat (LRR) protein
MANSKLVLLLFAFLMFVAINLAEPIPVKCNFIENLRQYTCELTGITIENDVSQSFVIEGNHSEGQSNDDVVAVLIRNARIPFVFKELFETFPNIRFLTVSRGGLKTFQKNAFFNAKKLENIAITENNITNLYPYAFIGATYVKELRLRDNFIQNLHKHALVGLNNLDFLNIDGNEIKEIPADFFRPAIRLRSLFVGNNQIERLRGDTFLRKYQIEQISFPSTGVNAIGRDFIDNLNLISLINLFGNECVNRIFELSRSTVESIKAELEPCFENFDSSL